MSYTLSRTHDRDHSNVSFVPPVSFVSLFVPNTDHTGTLRMRVDEQTLQRTTTCGKNCTTCPHINTESVIRAHSTGTNHGMVTDAAHDCNTKGLIYLIECRKCHYQYVGLTKQSLKQRLSGHKYTIKNEGQTLLARHFTSPDHGLTDLTIRVLQLIGTDNKLLHEAEDFWIRTLNTAYPLGLNERVRGCHGLIHAKLYDGSTGTPYLQNKGPGRIRQRGKHKSSKPAFTIEQTIAHLNNELRDAAPLQVLVFLRGLRQPIIRALRQALTTTRLDHSLRIAAAFSSGLITARYQPKRREPKITVIAQYVNHGLSAVLYDNIFHHRQLRRILPDVTEIGVRIAYKRDAPLGRLICNHTSFLKTLTTDTILEFNRHTCDCAHSPYIYAPHGHVITGDLKIIEDLRLRTIMGYGSKYRIPVEVNIDNVVEQTNELLSQFIRKYKGEHKHNLNAYCERYRFIIDDRISRYKASHLSGTITPRVHSMIKRLQHKYIIAPADKASNNLVIMCKKYYLQAMCDEMGMHVDTAGRIRVEGNDVYEPTAHTLDTLTRRHAIIAARYHAAIGNDNMIIPLINGIPKLHKVPYKMRFLAGARLSTVKNVSIIAHKILKCLYTVFKNYCGVISDRGTRPNSFWSINNSSDAIKCLQRPGTIKSLITLDFSTLFTALSHNDIKTNLNWLINKMFTGPGRGQVLAVGRDKAFFTKEIKERAFAMDVTETMLLMEDVIDNAFVTFAGSMFRQTKGVPMGGNCSPMMADLCLTVMEHRYIMDATVSVQYGLRYVVRYIDDILVANYDCFPDIAKDIYPSELILKRADNPLDDRVAFLDLHINRHPILNIDLYDKTRDFNFQVVKFAHVTSNVPPSSTYQIFYSQLVRISRIATERDSWLIRVLELNNACLQVGANHVRLSNTFGRFCGKHQNLLWKYGIYTDNDRITVALAVLK